MASIRIREVTDSKEGGPSVVFETDDGRKFNLQDQEQKKKLMDELAKNTGE